MLYRKPRVGQDINAYCGKCKDERTHVVAAMDGETVRRVTCSMCGGTHNYRSKTAAPAKTTRSKAAATTKGGKRTSQAKSFEIDPAQPVKNYNMNASFSAGDVISHPKFGRGKVEAAVPPNKIEVRFQEGRKMLLHNMQHYHS